MHAERAQLELKPGLSYCEVAVMNTQYSTENKLGCLSALYYFHSQGLLKPEKLSSCCQPENHQQQKKKKEK